MLQFSVETDFRSPASESQDFAVRELPDPSRWRWVGSGGSKNHARIYRASFIIRRRQGPNRRELVDYATANANFVAIKKLSGYVLTSEVTKSLAARAESPDEVFQSDDPAASSYSMFKPSSELTAYWLRGVADHLREMQASQDFRQYLQDAELTPEQMIAEFGVRLHRIFSTIANRQRYDIEPRSPIAKGNAFSLTFQHHILDRLPIRPDAGAAFYSLLLSELQVFLKRGEEVSGTWGKLRLDRDSIIIDFTPRNSVTAIPGRSRAQVIE